MIILTPAVLCLSMAIYHEARGEPIAGQIAVAEVVMNRVDDPRFPDTVCSVVKQKHQFAPAAQQNVPMKDETAKATAIVIATAVINSEIKTLDGNPVYFNTLTVSPKHVSNKKDATIIGDHVFFDK